MSEILVLMVAYCSLNGTEIERMIDNRDFRQYSEASNYMYYTKFNPYTKCFNKIYNCGFKKDKHPTRPEINRCFNKHQKLELEK